MHVWVVTHTLAFCCLLPAALYSSRSFESPSNFRCHRPAMALPDTPRVATSKPLSLTPCQKALSASSAAPPPASSRGSAGFGLGPRGAPDCAIFLTFASTSFCKLPKQVVGLARSSRNLCSQSVGWPPCLLDFSEHSECFGFKRRLLLVELTLTSHSSGLVSWSTCVATGVRDRERDLDRDGEGQSGCDGGMDPADDGSERVLAMLRVKAGAMLLSRIGRARR